MDYGVKKDTLTIDPEIRRYRKDSFTISAQASGEEVEPDEFGRKIVPIGSLIDKDGKICKISGSSIEGTPIGITTNSVDVTHSTQPVAVYTRAHLQGKMLNLGEEEYSDEIGTAIETALPEIHIYPRPPKAAAGAGAAAAPTTVDLSKATGTLAVEHGGTGATSAEAALEALNGQEKLDDPLPIANGGTGASDAESALTALGGAKDTEFQKVKATVEEQHPE